MKGNKPTPEYMYESKNDRSGKTKKDIKILKDHTVIIGEKHYHAPKGIQENPIAKAKWLEIMHLYEKSTIDITTNADVGLLERYCHTYCEYKELLATKVAVKNRFPEEPIEAMKVMDALKLDSKLNQKNSILMKMDEQLFLTPLSKCRAVPRSRPKKTKNKLKERGFNL